MVPHHNLSVEVVRATGLELMNHFIGHDPYVQVEVKHFDRARPIRATTNPVTTGDTMNPVWEERLDLWPWVPGEALEFTVRDKGLTDAQTEGKVHLPSDMFYPEGFNGKLDISDVPGAQLEVHIFIFFDRARRAFE